VYQNKKFEKLNFKVSGH